MNANELAEYVTNVINCTEDWETDYFKQVVAALCKLHKYELRNEEQRNKIAILEAKLSEALDAENDRRFE